MIKKHQESTYREKERIKDKGSKQEKRSDLQLKKNETTKETKEK